MADTLYQIREKANPDNIIACNWQNAFELVNHGFWEWAAGNGAKEFRRAQKEARGTNPDPQGFEHLNDVTDSDDDDDDDRPARAPAPAPVAPKPTVSQVASTVVDTNDDGLEDLSRDELFALVEKETGSKIDRRTGTKKLIELIREAKEDTE